ncbi:flagellar biosynthetic protein FliR [Novosphingobium sp. FSY-8]|uniref:Flagellar biosynthetic protein FliR n=1 Tax=Novosphingobium ovatum TaxID=1908523 RepID=A0ABW9XG45_9SPHN|nr:flagellar biosynthetic protein FliR [Novosphingobium ovatum]NBC37521.1 flagellar biosynthetic protein FliR [Novosphingobium ovatum]
MIALDFGFGPLEAEFWRWVFLMTRIGAALVAAPFFGTANVSAQIRVITAAAIALLVANWVPIPALPNLFSLPGFLAIMGEVLIGTALGFVLQFAFAAPTIAAELMGGAMGMSLAATVDPQNGRQSPALGQYFGVMLTLVFFGLGAHLQWIGLLVKSYTAFPPGQVLGAFGPDKFLTIVSFATSMLVTAVVMAVPVVLVLFLIQTLAGVLSRSAPALNLFSLGLPAGIIGGIVALVVSAPMISDRMVGLTADAISASGSLLVR